MPTQLRKRGRMAKGREIVVVVQMMIKVSIFAAPQNLLHPPLYWPIQHCSVLLIVQCNFEVKGACPDQWTSLAGGCYKFLPEKLSWEDAKEACSSSLKAGWLADRDWFRRAKWCNSRRSFESRLSNCVDRTRWESYGRGICLGLRRNSQLHQLGTRPAQKPQKQSLTRRGRLCSHEHKGWKWVSQREAMVNSKEMEWCPLLS